MTSHTIKNNSKYNKCKYRGLSLFKGEGRRVRRVVKDIKGKKIIGKTVKKATRKIASDEKVSKKQCER